MRDATTGLPLAATIDVEGSVRDTFTDPALGDFHRILLPGAYALDVSSPGYSTARLDGVYVAAGADATRADVDLRPLAPRLEPVSHSVLDGPSGDGSLEPGESADLAVTLQDLGAATTGVTAAWSRPAGTLRSPAPMPPTRHCGWSRAESLPPHFGVALSP